MPSHSIYANVQRRLQELGWTEGALLRCKGMSKRLLRELAAHQAKPTVTTLVALADALQMPPHALLMAGQSNAQHHKQDAQGPGC